MTGRFYIDSLDLYTQYGITVLNSEGEIDLPKPKKRFEIDWPDDHGSEVDVRETYVEPKEIILECMLKQTTAANALIKLRALQTALNAAGLRQLKSFKDSPRAHMVFLVDAVKPERFEGGKVLLFKLKFLEPIPWGKQYTKTGPGTVTFSIQTTHALDIYWGDGTKDLGVTDDNQLEKTFTSGTYTIVVSGAVERATSYNQTGATEV